MSGGKTVAFQKLLCRMFFSQLFADQERPVAKESGRKIEFIVRAVSFFCIYIFLYMITSSSIPSLWMIFLLATIYQCIFRKEGMVFHLPLKNSFIIRNIFVFSTCSILAVNVGILLALYSLGVLFAVIDRSLTLSFMYDSYFMGWYFCILYTIIYTNGMLTTFFIKKQPLRIAGMIGYTLACSGFLFILYALSPKNKNDLILGFIMKPGSMPYNFSYFMVLIGVSILVTFIGLLFAERMNGPKRKPQFV